MRRFVTVGNADGAAEIDLDAREWNYGVGGGQNIALKVTLTRARRRLRDREQTTAAGNGAPYRLELVEPVVFELRLDTHGILELARKAARSKSRKAKRGPLTVAGGTPRPTWKRKEGWDDGDDSQ